MKIRKRFENQAVGLLPLLLFMVMDNYLSYKLSFAIGVVVCLLCLARARSITSCCFSPP